MLTERYHVDKLSRYICELEACADALHGDIDKADTLVNELKAEISSSQMQAFWMHKEARMPHCKDLEQMLRTLANEMRRVRELYEAIDEDVAAAFRL